MAKQTVQSDTFQFYDSGKITKLRRSDLAYAFKVERCQTPVPLSPGFQGSKQSKPNPNNCKHAELGQSIHCSCTTGNDANTTLCLDIMTITRYVQKNSCTVGHPVLACLLLFYIDYPKGHGNLLVNIILYECCSILSCQCAQHGQVVHKHKGQLQQTRCQSQ